MSRTEKATLKDGRTVDFLPEMIGEGGMKQVYFTADHQQVVCFFREKPDNQRIQRLEAVIGRFNPTTDPTTGEYWKKLFCWPTAVVTQPRLGVLAPKYPGNYFFAAGPWKGKEKKGRWFTGKTGGGKPFREMMPESERGTWINYFMLCIRLARAVRRLHMAGLAHSDLSCNNVLVDPSGGMAIVIDIDSLVVPGIFPPDVLGTPGYIAPEVLATHHLPLTDRNRIHPSARTDQHALAVLIYEYLLFRHPLRGPKVNSTKSAEEDDVLSFGAKALFVEHPTDTSNRPKDLKYAHTVLGPLLSDLFNRAFVKGLHSPNDRPAAAEWERGLIKTWDMLYPCPNRACSHKWFVFHNPTSAACQFCGTRLSGTVPSVPVLKLRSQRMPGQWMQDGQLVVYDKQHLFKWHAFDNKSSNEQSSDEDRKPVADFHFYQGQWILMNRALPDLKSPAGNPVPFGQAVALTDGAQVRLSTEPHGRIAEVQLIRT